MTRKYGTNKTEKAIIHSIGGKAHKNSGRNMKKGDGTWNEFVIDVKETNKSFTLSTDVWAKICTDAAKVDFRKEPALIVVFNGKTKLAVIAFDVLESLVRED